MTSNPAPAAFRTLVVLALLGAGTAAAAPRPTPVFKPLLGEGARRPVILVPGLTGSQLRDRESGEVIWGSGARVFSSALGPYDMARALGDPDADLEIEVDGVLETVNLGVIKKEVYGPIVGMLEEHGYQAGSLEDPRPGDTVFLFAYDWRQSNERTVAKLLGDLDRLRRTRGGGRLEVDLVCQSNGGHVCRYLAKYGGASYSDAAAGRGRPPAWLEVKKLVLVGTSSGGGMRILRELDRGRRYVPVVGRRMQPEMLFTFASLFEDLPFYRQRFFLDEDGNELDVDLYDPANWEKYGWSIFGEEARRRAEKHPDLFGGPETWRTYLRLALERARLVHELLSSDAPGFNGTRYYLIQNPSDPTPDRAVLAEKRGGFKLLFTGDGELERHPALLARASSGGDGHASALSQTWLSPQEAAAIVGEPFHVGGGHFDLVLNPESLLHLLEILHEDDGPPLLGGPLAAAVASPGPR